MTTMGLPDIIISANGGQQTAAIAAAAGIGPGEMNELVARQVPAIARRIHERTGDDEAELEAIFDILEDGEAEDYLSSPRILTSRAATVDGEDILEHLYGSMEKAAEAARELGAPRGVEAELAARLMTYSAVLTVAAMSRRYRAEVLPAAQMAQGSGGDILAMLVQAIIAGLIRALKNAILPRRRSRTRYSTRYRRRRRKTTRSRSRRYRRGRRSRSILEDVISDVLRGR